MNEGCIFFKHLAVPSGVTRKKKEQKDNHINDNMKLNKKPNIIMAQIMMGLVGRITNPNFLCNHSLFSNNYMYYFIYYFHLCCFVLDPQLCCERQGSLLNFT